MAFVCLKRDRVVFNLSPSPSRTKRIPADHLEGNELQESDAKRGKSAGSIAVEESGSPGHDKDLNSSADQKQARTRTLVREKFTQALGGQLLADGNRLAAEIEEALFQQLGTGKEFATQARAILFNLKDVGAGSLRQKLLEGQCNPQQLPRMSGDELLSDKKSQEKAKEQQKAAEASTVKAEAQVETDMFTCESCSGTRTKYYRTSELRTYGAEQKMVSVSHVTCLMCGQTWVTR